CCGSGILLNRLLESSLIFKGFSRLSTGLFALPLALSMWRIIETLITLASTDCNKIAKNGQLLVIHIKIQLLHTLIHRKPLKRALIDAPPHPAGSRRHPG
ncbi:hypothetical protein, partial [Aeromonas rivipollensis]|uniref:hypothetical protein n=2 Tax=Aeromonas rivipollensis TaxID=948519 RepID=UPI003D1BE889